MSFKNWLFGKATADEPYPYGMGEIRPRYFDQQTVASPILLGTRLLEHNDSIHLFAPSDTVKQQLEIRIAESRSRNKLVHPAALELRAAIVTISDFEGRAARHQDLCSKPMVIEHDNWQFIFWTFVQLFETGVGFLARWEGRYAYMQELWEIEPRYRVADLHCESLADNCGKRYTTTDGKLLLECVDSIL